MLNNTPKKSYREAHTLEERQKKVQSFQQRYPDMTPIIVEKHKRCKLNDLQRSQFLANSSIAFGEFRNQVKNKINLQPQQTLFFYCGNVIIQDDDKLVDLYNKHKDKDDGFLYLLFSDAEVFGA